MGFRNSYLKIFFMGILLIYLVNFAFAIDDLLALQGNVQQSGVNLASGNLRVLIYDAINGGNLIYNSSTDFNNAVSSGKYDVMLGNGTQTLSLEYGQIYYIEMYVNGEKFTFNGANRQILQSSTGQINASFISVRQINASHLAYNINLSNATGYLASNLVGSVSISQLSGFENVSMTNQSTTWDAGTNVSVGVGGWFKGAFKWVIDALTPSSYATFNGTTLWLNTTYFYNMTIASSSSNTNIFNQWLNTTSNVTFYNISVGQEVVINGVGVSQWLYNQTQSPYFYNMTATAYFYNMTVLGGAGYNETYQAHINNLTQHNNTFWYNQTATAYFYNMTQSAYFYNMTQSPYFYNMSVNFGSYNETYHNLIGLNTSQWIVDGSTIRNRNAGIVNVTTGLYVSGRSDFNGGWENNGVSIINGDVFAQTVYVLNITSLSVSNVNVNGSLIPGGGFDNTFNLGSPTLQWANVYAGSDVIIGGTNVKQWLYNQTQSAYFYNMTQSAYFYNMTVYGLAGYNATYDAHINNLTQHNTTFWYNQTAGTIDISNAKYLNLSGTNANQNIYINSYNFTTLGRIGIGTNTPSYILDIIGGSIRINNSVMWLGPVVSSDGNALTIRKDDTGGSLHLIQLQNYGGPLVNTGSDIEFKFLNNNSIETTSFILGAQVLNTSDTSYTVISKIQTTYNGLLKNTLIGRGRQVAFLPSNNGPFDYDINLFGSSYISTNLTIGNNIFINNTDVYVGTIGLSTWAYNQTATAYFYNMTQSPYFYNQSLYADNFIKNGSNAWLNTLNVSGELVSGLINISGAGGKVGIGTTTPSQKLTIVSGTSGERTNITGDGKIFLDDSASDATPLIHFGWSSGYVANISLPYGTRATEGFIIGTSAAYPVSIKQGGGTALYIDTSKRVGIGTITPSNKLQVNTGGFSIEDSTTNLGGFNVSSNARITTISGLPSGTTLSTASLVVNPAGVGDVNRLLLGVGHEGVIHFSVDVEGDSYFAGNMGIGTTAPAYLLETAKSPIGANLSGTLYVNGTSGMVGVGNLNPSAKLDILSTTDNHLRLTHTAGTYYWNIFRQASDGSLVFNDSIGSPEVVFTSGGNVGIGTTTPDATLEVIGQIYVDANDDASSILLSDTGITSYVSDLNLRTRLVQDIYLGNNTNNYMKIEGTNGNVGIGTTSPTQTLDVNGNINISAATGNLTMGGGKIYYDVTNARLVIKVS